eukprot:3820272-Amphidinium_carterae.1
MVVKGTILPGCSCAVMLMKMLVWKVVQHSLDIHPGLDIGNVVDDIGLQVSGHQGEVARTAVQAATGIMGQLEDLELVIN